jgi:para-nitrobenzyl esterase
VTTTANDKPKLTVIQTDKGKVRCSQFETHLEGRGIPYAAPPVGDLRLRAPVEHDAWTDVRDATRFASASLQSKTEYDREQGSEDCLYLNVYRPGSATDGSPLPVMMWIHGGGFVNGSGNAFYGAFLAQTANAVVVTINYRLGPLGWLALPSLAAEAKDHSTGNYGLLDSIAALNWIRRNISSFGGDAGRVTILDSQRAVSRYWRWLLRL